MAYLKQRVFMIFLRPCYVKAGPGAGYPNVVTKYIGKMYRAPVGGESAPTLSPTTPGYAAAIELPALNASVLTTGTSMTTGGGIERFYDNIGRGRMPADKPSQTLIDAKKLEVENKNEDVKQAEAALAADPANPTLISTLETKRQELEVLKHELNTMLTGAETFSKPPFNENHWFSNDYWALHSTWTSFEEAKNYVRQLIDLLGFDGVMVTEYVELSMELLPTK